jgi:ribosomal protein L40E
MATKIIKCEACGADISNQAEKCPHCGHPNKKVKKPVGCLQVIGGLVVFLMVIGFLAGGNDKLAKHEMQKIENQVADDAVAQYNIAKKQGDKIQICVQAGFVSAAYLQAKDDANYNQWKTTQKQDCKAAGMPNL